MKKFTLIFGIITIGLIIVNIVKFYQNKSVYRIPDIPLGSVINANAVVFIIWFILLIIWLTKKEENKLKKK